MDLFIGLITIVVVVSIIMTIYSTNKHYKIKEREVELERERIDLERKKLEMEKEKV